jgi:hypothetical protein
MPPFLFLARPKEQWMAVWLCNLLGSLCTTYRFDDASLMRRSSRESITYDGVGNRVDIEFYCNGSAGYAYCLPNNIVGEDRAGLIRKVEEYCRKKGYKIATSP